MVMKGQGGGGDIRKRRKRTDTLRLTAEFLADVGWWRWYVQLENIKEGERIAAPFYRFVKQTPEEKRCSDASYEAIGGLCLETGVYWRFKLTGEVKRRTVRSKRGKRDRISINLLELMSMVMAAYVMVVMKGDRPEKEGATVLMRGDDSSAVQWVINCKGGRRDEMRTGALIRMLAALEMQGGRVFSGKACEGGRQQTCTPNN